MRIPSPNPYLAVYKSFLGSIPGSLFIFRVKSMVTYDLIVKLTFEDGKTQSIYFKDESMVSNTMNHNWLTITKKQFPNPSIDYKGFDEDDNLLYTGKIVQNTMIVRQ